MAEVILMPRLSDTMTEGVIAAWHKSVGDSVKKGDLLAEIETDKATMELESYQQGVLLHVGGSNGQKLQVNDLLAIIGKAGEDVSNLIAANLGNNNAASVTETKETPQTNTNSASSTIDISTMEEVVLMPRLSDTMTEGVVAAWHKNVGDTVAKGEVLAEIETDKATMDLESYKNGTLLYQGATAGVKIQVNDLLCVIGDDKTNLDAIIAASKNKTTVTEQPTKVEAVATTTSVQQPQQKTAIVVNDGRILASPLAKKLADEKGIDLKYVKGSGDAGRIVKSDVENYKPTTSVATSNTSSVVAPKPMIPTAPAGQVSFTDTPVSQMRKVIAKRLAESKFTAPHFYLTMSVDMDATVAARTKMNETSAVKISFNDFVLKAVALSLKQHPAVNSSWLGDTIRTNYHVNIGVAVAVDDGLLVPVVRFADGKSLSQISVEVKEYAQKAKDKKLQPSDWEGNTFTISNLGMFGIDEFTAIINPPDACILAVGGISKVPVVKNNQVVPGNIMKLTLSCDHRVVDGASGAAFLQTLKSLLEEPLRMLL